jgi:hypothetical protein
MNWHEAFEFLAVISILAAGLMFLAATVQDTKENREIAVEWMLYFSAGFVLFGFLTVLTS